MSDSYYRPYYPSDSEGESELSSLASGQTTPTSQAPGQDFAAFARQLNQALTAGPTFSTVQQQLEFGVNRLSRNISYGPYQPSDGTSGIPTKPKDTSRASIIMLQSRDRDRSIYPQPTFCVLNLPRVYNNIKSFQIAQISLLSAFYYFRPDKENLLIQIEEQDRVVYDINNQPIYDTTVTPNVLLKNIIDTTIRQGTYSISQLITELTTRLNTPPLFYDFPNGISDFNAAFQVNGDFSLNFNYPGDYFYDSLKEQYYPNPTRTQIAQAFFQSSYAPAAAFYTIEQVQVSYYYPVLRECLVEAPESLVLPASDPAGMSTTDRIFYGFTGIDDTFVLSIILDNKATLDQYRLTHTFRYGLINKYNVFYQTNTNRIVIQAVSLNTSLVNLLNSKYNLYLSQQLIQAGLTNQQYNSLLNSLVNRITTFQDMFRYLETQLALYFGVSRGSYAKEYYTDIQNNYFLIQNGLNLKKGDGGVILINPISTNSISTNILLSQKTRQPNYWPALTNMPLPIQTISTNMGPSGGGILFPATSNFPFYIGRQNVDLTTNFIDVSDYVNTDFRRRCADLIIDVNPMEYTILKFKSKYRQTLQVETFPRPTALRNPEYLSTIGAAFPLQDLFNRTYTFSNPTDPTKASKLRNSVPIQTIPGFYLSTTSDLNFGSSFQTLNSLWSTTNPYINLTRCNAFFGFTTPLPSMTLDSTLAYKYTMNLTFSTTVAASNTNSDLVFFFYRDYGTFLADVTSNRFENPIHYYFSTVIPYFQPTTTVSFTAFANTQYFINLRSVEYNPNTVNYKVTAWFNDTSYTTLSTTLSDYNPLADPTLTINSIYSARIVDSNYLHLPTASTLWQNDPSQDPLNTISEADPPSIGYDSNDVSNDLTDYMPFSPYNTASNINPEASVRCDPTNNYFFLFKSPYNSDPLVQNYFYTGSSNALVSPNLEKAYFYTTPPAKRQYKIAQWYGTHYASERHLPEYLNDVPQSPYIKPILISSTDAPLADYFYQNQNQELSFDNGVCGFAFLPSDGIWEVDRITFKSNFTDSTQDCNAPIQHLGVFLTAEITNTSIYQISLSTALFKLDYETKITYSNDYSLNEGFDSQLGTYYTFRRDTSFTLNSSTIMTGYTQNGKVIITNPNAFYSVIPFDSNFNPMKIINMVGSLVPYPYAYTPHASTFYYGTQAPTRRKGLIVPSLSTGITPEELSLYGPPPGIDETTSVYEQSVPQVNTILHYYTSKDMIADSNAFYQWSTIPVQFPIKFCPSVKGYALFQDNSITVATYPFNSNTIQSNDRYFKLKGVFSVDSIFPAAYTSYVINTVGTAYLGFAGNDSNFYFYGAHMTAPGPTAQLIIKEYDILNSGAIYTLPIYSHYTLPQNVQVTQVLANAHQGFFIAGTLPTRSTFVAGTPVYLSTNSFTTTYYATDSISIGMDPNGEALYVLTYDSAVTTGASTLYKYPLSNFNTPTFPSPSLLQFFPDVSLPRTMSQIMVAKNQLVEEIYMLSEYYSPTAPRNFFRIKTYLPTGDSNTTYAVLEGSVFQFQYSNTGVMRPPITLINGYGGSRWALFSNEGYIYGNRNDAVDAPISIANAWQILYPTVKIQMTRQANTYTPVTDLTGLTYPEYPHSMLFGYQNLSSLNADLYVSSPGSLLSKWGKESNFYVSDAQMNGFYFNSYIKIFPLEPYVSTLSNDYYIALRGYSPTESYQTMIRLYMPNRYDFGFVTANDLIEEVPLLLGSNFWDSNRPVDSNARPEFFNPTYGQVLKLFNEQFTFLTPRLFGSNDTLNYPGTPISSFGYFDFMSQYSNYYSSYKNAQETLNSIQNSVTSNFNTFIANNLQYILPSAALYRQRYTDPIPFRILWSSCLTSNFSVLEDEWGLGWNLGFPKQDTPFATTQIAPTFYKILDEYIYLRLNDAFNLNRLDKGAKENYKLTREPTGTIQSYNSKLLLTNFGNYANVIVQNPISFDPVLARMDKLSFTWLDPTGNVINNNDCEWTVSINIVENV